MEKKEKKSWREIDRQRDRGDSKGKNRDRERSSLEKALDGERFREQYLREAERLFMGPKGRPEHARDLQAIHEAYGKKNFPDAVRHYMDTYGLPEDWGTLSLLLDLKEDPGTVCAALSRLCILYREKGPVEQRGFRSKLNIIMLTSRDQDVLDEAQATLDQITP